MPITVIGIQQLDGEFIIIMNSFFSENVEVSSSSMPFHRFVHF